MPNFSTIQTLNSTSSAITTNPASTTTEVVSLLLHNTNTTGESVELNFVPNVSGALGTVALTNRIYKFSLSADETVDLCTKFPFTLLGTNTAIFAKSTTASKVTATVHGRTLP